VVVNCDLNLPVNIVKALGLSEDEIACTLKKRISSILFPEKSFKFWTGKAACKYFNMGFPEPS